MASQLVYLVRHGATLANIENRVQSFEEPLSELGSKQAEALAERCSHLEFETLIASDMLRTRETASFISEKTDHEIILEPLFREITRPAKFEGLSRDSIEYQTFLADELKHMDDPNWNYFEGELFASVSKRALDALAYLENRQEKSLLVVSHGLFLRYLVATVLTEKNLTTDIWHHLSQTMQMHNTGITILKRDIETNTWSLRTWNDHAHFAE
ncbi:hypothetical protein A2592_03285 [Candidatus Kaiserbacteria bacterium RIFOXYD1_FULL_42_15]|uniref:Phosphoglycerate mutase n=1 Tax=Candidatus Kaiserbacteria bacterium RIFOXYD1_FULL_42_15 TaxID=1798532 RepID=A0A1F6FPE1_9BACT|nr:MAG: hypothetical protein A2592_03285 [Candidatus Kaiserbacteria bacterium RIFOXYD1_FULL_42_15]